MGQPLERALRLARRALGDLGEPGCVDVARVAQMRQREEDVYVAPELQLELGDEPREGVVAGPALYEDAHLLASLGRAVRYRVRRANETDRKTADHIREYGHLINQTLRRMFDLDVAGARDLLRALQQRGVIVKLDQGRGGPGNWRWMLESRRATARVGGLLTAR